MSMDVENDIVIHIKVKREDLNLSMRNFHEEIILMSMFIFITLYLIIELVF